MPSSCICGNDFCPSLLCPSINFSKFTCPKFSCPDLKCNSFKCGDLKCQDVTCEATECPLFSFPKIECPSCNFSNFYEIKCILIKNNIPFILMSSLAVILVILIGIVIYKINKRYDQIEKFEEEMYVIQNSPEMIEYTPGEPISNKNLRYEERPMLASSNQGRMLANRGHRRALTSH